MQKIIVELDTLPYNVSYYRYSDGLLKFKGKLIVENTGDLRLHILNHMHNSSVGGHSGITATYKRVASVF